MTPATVVLAADQPQPIAPGWQLILAALAGIAVIVVLITVVKLHPFLALIFGSVTVGLVAAENAGKVLDSFGKGFGDTATGVGILIALGAMFAKLLADSGGADEIVDTIVGHASARSLPWAMALVGAIIGLPMFFEIGVVLLVPVIYLVSRRSQLPLIAVGIPALAGLSAMHGLVPPHPGPLTAIGLLKADLGVTLALGIAVAVPTVVIAGPLFGKLAARWVPVGAPSTFSADDFASDLKRRPSFASTLFSILLPVALMLGKALVDIFINDQNNVARQVFDVLGRPLVALLIAVVVGMFTLGRGAGMTRDELMKCVESGLPPVAGIILIVAAGGGFKQVLVDSGIGTLLADWAKNVHISVILLAWLLAVFIRLATGSATVATITASSLMLGLVEGLSTGQVSLVVLAVGAGSLFFSHVNDAGFWLVKEFFG
ncbi:MAG: gluconate:H+ symporter, GntP family, partial [Mycobacterium sp.]|nr:gluconate:H+ symporter, GntP family [Mycobacterium sp.]